MRLFFTVAERGVAIPVTREQLIHYAGPSQIIATALMFRLFGQAFDELSPGKPPERTEISALTAFPGPGILDCIEYATRARTFDDGRLIIDVNAGPEDAPPSVEGRFYFEIEIGGRRRGYWPVSGFFDKTFLDMVRKYQDSAPNRSEEAWYRNYKEQLVGRLLAAPDGELFNSRDIALVIDSSIP